MENREMANIGWVKLGEKKGNYGTMIDHFKITDMTFDKKTGNFKEDETLKLKNNKEIDIFFYYNEISNVFQIDYIMNVKNGKEVSVKCKNGTVQDTGQKVNCPCNHYKKGNCDRVGILHMGLKKNPIIGASYQLKTKGYYLIKNILNSLEEIKSQTNGTLKYIPLKIILQPQQTSKGQKFVPKIIFKGTIFELMENVNEVNQKLFDLNENFKLDGENVIDPDDEQTAIDEDKIIENTIETHENETLKKMINQLGLTEDESKNYYEMDLDAAIKELDILFEDKFKNDSIETPIEDVKDDENIEENNEIKEGFIEADKMYGEIENELFNRLINGKQQGKLNKENINKYLPKMLQVYINDYKKRGIKTDPDQLYAIVGQDQKNIVEKLFADENVESSDIDVEFDTLIKKAVEKKIASLKMSKIKRLFNENKKVEAVEQLKELLK